MTSQTTESFRRLYAHLPADVQRMALRAYRLWRKNPHHPGLQFKQVHARPIYSVRIGLHWRAVGTRTGNEMIWYWIGSHAEYDRLLHAPAR